VQWDFTRFVGLACLVLILGCNGSTNKSFDSRLVLAKELSPETTLLVEQFCGNCHPTPAPTSFPKSNWPAEVERGFNFYFESGRRDLQIPLVLDTIQYFQSQAPDKINLPSAEDFPTAPTDVRFVGSPLLLSGDSISLTADIQWDGFSQSLYFSDMANSKLRSWSIAKGSSILAQSPDEFVTLGPDNVVAKGNHLCRMHACDWNKDGIRDYLVAEIGSMIISDQKLGSVSVFIGQSDGKLNRVVLAEELARPAEAVPFDYDDDGDLDILVAEFGYQKSGCLSLLRNQSNDSAIPSLNASDFQYEILDPRHGHVAVIVCDMDGDSKLDIVTAIGQEYEAIEIRYNEGRGEYQKQIVMALPDPSYNTSSIQVCDVDQDGRVDILHTCGDIFDSFVPKPYHGVRWVRNLGDGRWELRELGMLVGAMQTTAADFDLDGDLDIAAVGLFPLSNRQSNGKNYDSVCWWEQKENLEFVRHSIEQNRCLHSSCAAHDLDGDGRPELIVGEWAEGKTSASLRIFWNHVSTEKKANSLDTTSAATLK